jgi:hypothetical protein
MKFGRNSTTEKSVSYFTSCIVRAVLIIVLAVVCLLYINTNKDTNDRSVDSGSVIVVGFFVIMLIAIITFGENHTGDICRTPHFECKKKNVLPIGSDCHCTYKGTPSESG